MYFYQILLRSVKEVLPHFIQYLTAQNGSRLLEHRAMSSCKGKQEFFLYYFRFTASVDVNKCLDLVKSPISLIKCAPLNALLPKKLTMVCLPSVFVCNHFNKAATIIAWGQKQEKYYNLKRESQGSRKKVIFQWPGHLAPLPLELSGHRNFFFGNK